MKLFNADGTPTKRGLSKLVLVQKELNELFKLDEINNLTENQKRILGGWLAKMVWDTISNLITKNSKVWYIITLEIY